MGCNLSQQGRLIDQNLESLTGDTGGPVFPDASETINIIGGGTVSVAGNPGTSTLTINTSAGGFPISPYVVGIAGQAGYQTIQAGMDAANAAGGGTVYVQPGAYTENLTFYDGVDLHGAIGQVDSGFLTVTGLHTLPASGDMATYGIWYKGTTACFTAAAGGTAKINMFNVITEISGVGYSFDIDGYAGEINIFDYLQFDGGTNGFVNNPTGGCEVNIIFAGIGLTQTLGATAQISGDSFFQGMLVAINLNFVGTSSSFLNMGCEFYGTISTADSASVDIATSYSLVETAQAINHLSSGTVTLTNVGINSSNVTPIDGTGNITLANVGFTDVSTIAGTLTVTGGNNYSGTYKSDYTDGGVLLGQGAVSNIVATTAGADGQLLIGATGADPAFASLTPDHTIAVTEGPNTLNIAFSDDAHITALHGWNGAILETDSVTVTAAGGVITCSIELAGGGDLTVMFSDDWFEWDTTPPDTVTLTAGTDASPQINYVYLLQSTKVLTASTTGWPTTEHAPICTTICQSAASLQTNGPIELHVWTDHIVSTNNQGHLSHLGFWIREQNATWASGVNQTYTITANGGSADNVTIATIAGTVLQLHEQTYPAFLAADDYYVINDSVTPYTIVNDLNALLTDSGGVSMSNKYFSLVLWGVVSEDTGDCKRFINLPSGTYNTQTGVLNDASGFANFNIPSDFKGTGFLISEWKLRHQVAASGTWTSIDEVDLRGLVPSISPTGSTATPTTFVDTAFRIFDDGDATKLIAFEASGITNATTRTLTVQDADGTIALSGVANFGTGATSFTDHGVLVGSGTSPITPLAAATNGQLIIGSSGADPAIAALASADASITITNGAGTIDLSVNAGGIPWTEVTGVGPTAMAVDNGYVANNVALVTLTLPDTAALGSKLKIDGKGAGGWLIAQNAGETIHFSGQDTTPGAGGSLDSTQRYDCVTLRCITADTDWIVEAVIGNPNPV